MRVLVITPATHSGAPRVMLDLCGRLKARDYEFRILTLKRGGPWGPELSALGPVGEWSSAGPTLGTGSSAFLGDWAPDAVYVNTAAGACALAPLAALGVPVVLHVHELQGILSRLAGQHEAAFRTVPTCYIAASAAVKDCLVSQWGIEASRVAVCYEAIDTARVAALRAEAGPKKADALIVGGLGKANERKGADLWIQVAAEVRCRVPGKVRFLWIGSKPGPDQGPFWQNLDRDIRDLGIESVTDFSGPLENPYPALDAVDVLALTSREDPCPLAMLEAMYLRKPVVYFRSSGGAVEVVRDDAGAGVDGLSVKGMAAAIARLLEDAESRRGMGATGAARVADMFDIARLVGEMDNVFRQVVRSRNR